jgi:hypothetical protein
MHDAGGGVPGDFHASTVAESFKIPFPIKISANEIYGELIRLIF